jgi:hypothetical protein
MGKIIVTTTKIMIKQTIFNRNKLIGFITGSLLLVANLFPIAAHAASASMSLSGSGSVSPGAEFVVAVYMNGGGNSVYGVQADIDYSTSKLQYVGISYSGSGFSIPAPNNGGGSGLVSIANGTVSPISGGALVATITFKALGTSGSTSLGFDGQSAMSNGNGDPIPFGTSGKAITFASYSAPVSSSHVSATTTTAAVAPATPAPPKDTTPPVISAIKLTNVTPFTATVTWTTNEASDSAVDYGLDNTYGLSASNAGKTTAHSVALNSSFLTPFATLHYRLKSADAAGNLATSTDQTLQLPGVPVTVTVYGSNGKPQAGASVSLDGQTATTNAQGTATLQSGLGNKQLVTNYNGVTVRKPVTVTKSTKALINYQLDLNRQPTNKWMLSSLTLVVLLLVLIGFDAYLFRSRIFGKLLLKLHYWHLTRPTPAFAGQKATEKSTAMPIVKQTSGADILDVPLADDAVSEPAPSETSLPITPLEASAVSGMMDITPTRTAPQPTPVVPSPVVAPKKPVHHRKKTIKIST